MRNVDLDLVALQITEPVSSVASPPEIVCAYLNMLRKVTVLNSRTCACCTAAFGGKAQGGHAGAFFSVRFCDKCPLRSSLSAWRIVYG